MSKHIPGPWRYVLGHEGRAYHIRSGPVQVALTLAASSYDEADARLIAAAPDLLEAACIAFGVLDGGRYQKEADALCAAIAKATGEGVRHGHLR